MKSSCMQSHKPHRKELAEISTKPQLCQIVKEHKSFKPQNLTALHTLQTVSHYNYQLEMYFKTAIKLQCIVLNQLFDNKPLNSSKT